MPGYIDADFGQERNRLAYEYHLIRQQQYHDFQVASQQFFRGQAGPVQELSSLKPEAGPCSIADDKLLPVASSSGARPKQRYVTLDSVTAPFPYLDKVVMKEAGVDPGSMESAELLHMAGEKVAMDLEKAGKTDKTRVKKMTRQRR